MDLFGEERSKCEAELLSVEQMLSCITDISINGADLILDRVFDKVGFNRIEDPVFRRLVKARLSYPASKAATVEYLKNHFDEDVSLSKIYHCPFILRWIMRMNCGRQAFPKKGDTRTHK